LRYDYETLSNPDFNTIASSVIAFGSNGLLNVKSTLENISHVSIYDVLGRMLYTQQVQNTNEFVVNTTITKQTIIVQIELENGQLVSKKLIL
jgi:hypothetical protein